MKTLNLKTIVLIILLGPAYLNASDKCQTHFLEKSDINSMNNYERLGVDKNAKPEEIEEAYQFLTEHYQKQMLLGKLGQEDYAEVETLVELQDDILEAEGDVGLNVARRAYNNRFEEFEIESGYDEIQVRKFMQQYRNENSNDNPIYKLTFAYKNLLNLFEPVDPNTSASYFWVNFSRISDERREEILMDPGFLSLIRPGKEGDNQIEKAKRIIQNQRYYVTQFLYGQESYDSIPVGVEGITESTPGMKMRKGNPDKREADKLVISLDKAPNITPEFVSEYLQNRNVEVEKDAEGNSLEIETFKKYVFDSVLAYSKKMYRSTNEEEIALINKSDKDEFIEFLHDRGILLSLSLSEHYNFDELWNYATTFSQFRIGSIYSRADGLLDYVLARTINLKDFNQKVLNIFKSNENLLSVEDMGALYENVLSHSGRLGDEGFTSLTMLNREFLEIEGIASAFTGSSKYLLDFIPSSGDRKDLEIFVRNASSIAYGKVDGLSEKVIKANKTLLETHYIPTLEKRLPDAVVEKLEAEFPELSKITE